MLRRRLVLGVLVVAASTALARTLVQEEEAGPRFDFRHEGGDGTFPFVPMEAARYEAFRVVKVDAAGGVDRSYSARGVPVEGVLRRAVVTRGDARAVELQPWGTVDFEAGAATFRDANIRGRVRVRPEGRPWTDVGAEPISGAWSLLPPLAAIVLAIALREVLLALLAGVWAGALVLQQDLLQATKSTIDLHVVGSIAEEDHVKILVFSSLLGAVVAMVARMGGIRAIVEALAKRGRTATGAQLSTWVMGILIFFDDYANALLVGNTMRPISDRFRVSREKLSYLVDSTAAPMSCIAIISTWIAAEISYISSWLSKRPEAVAGYQPDAAYQMFLDSVPYSFYPVLALFFALMVVVSRRDFGPMWRAERRARTTGKVLADGATPLMATELDEAGPVDATRIRWWNGALPILTVILGVVVGLYLDGHPKYEADLAAATARVQELERTAGGLEPGVLERARETLASLEASGFLEELRQAYGAANSYDVLLWASFGGLLIAWVLALAQRLLSLREASNTTIGGVKAMLVACLVLVLAWSLSDVCGLLNTSGFLIHQVDLDFNLLPVAVFLLAAVVGFSTGSSWGTMGILIPLTLSYAYQLSLDPATGVPSEELGTILVGSLGGVLAGAVFGDHCSPISDTTVMSSMATGADHVDHVKTQLPYAVVVALVAVVTGYVPAGFGVPPWICLGSGLVLLAIVLRLLGRRLPASPEAAGPAA